MEQSEELEKIENAESETSSDSTQTSNKLLSTKRRIMLLVIIVACVIMCAVGIFLLRGFGVVNTYEKDYIDVTGRTAADIAREKNYKYEKFLKEYGLPADMPKNTSERAVYYNIPIKVFVKKTPGVESFEQLKEQMGWDDTITEDTTIGDALDVTKLKYYVGENQIERFKALYDLDSNVNGETLYGEVRNIVDTKEKELYQAEKKK